MKPTTSYTTVLFASLAAAQKLEELSRPQWISPISPVWEQCEDVCEQSVDSQVVCDRRYIEDITLEDHKECMCQTVFPETYECLSCALEASEDEESVYEGYSSMVDVYSSSLCNPSASIFFDDVITSMLVEEGITETGSVLTLTPIDKPIVMTTKTTQITHTSATPTPSADEGDDEGDDNEESNDDDAESTGAAPAITQAPLVFAAAGIALAAAL